MYMVPLQHPDKMQASKSDARTAQSARSKSYSIDSILGYDTSSYDTATSANPSKTQDDTSTTPGQYIIGEVSQSIYQCMYVRTHYN